MDEKKHWYNKYFLHFDSQEDRKFMEDIIDGAKKARNSCGSRQEHSLAYLFEALGSAQTGAPKGIIYDFGIVSVSDNVVFLKMFFDDSSEEELEEAIRKRFPGATLYFLRTQSSDGIFLTNDRKKVHFTARFFFDDCECMSSYFDTEQEAINCINHAYRQNFTSLEEVDEFLVRESRELDEFYEEKPGTYNLQMVRIQEVD